MIAHLLFRELDPDFAGDGVSSSDKSIMPPMVETGGYVEGGCLPYAFQGLLDCRYLPVDDSAWVWERT